MSAGGGPRDPSMAVDPHDDVKPSRPLIANLIHSLLDWDTAYEDVMIDWPKGVVDNKPIGMTEERLKIATRNRMRERGQEFPEVARWRLRIAVNFRSEEE